MRARRLVALFLSIAMIVTSGGFSSIAYAATPDGGSDVTISEEESVSEDVALTESEELTSEEASSSENMGETDSASEDESLTDQTDTEDESSETEVETSDEAVTEEETASEDEAAKEDKDAAKEDPEMLGEPVSSCFEIAEDGALARKEGESLAVEVLIPKEATSIPADVFANDTTVQFITFEDESALTSIAAGAFSKCSSLKSVKKFPSGVTAIPDNAFSDCASLSVLEFSSSSEAITSIGKEAFKETSLANVEFSGVTSVGNDAFSGCDKLKTVSLPALVTIGEKAFEDCTLLDTFSYAETITSIGEKAFSGTGLKNADMSSIKTSNITIGASAFAGSISLESVKFPKDLKTVPAKAFKGCTKLSAVVFGENTEIIESEAFLNCTSLVNIYTKYVYSFGSDAFGGCSSIKNVYFYYPTPEDEKFTIEQTAFPMKNNDAKMYGYNGKVHDYADKRQYKFVSVFDSHDINAAYNSNQVELSFSKNRAQKGEKITIRVTPKPGYKLKTIELSDAETELQFDSEKDKTLIFSFSMPNKVITATITMVKDDVTLKGPLTYRFDPVNSYTPKSDAVSNIRIFDYTGREARFVVENDGVSTDSWLWTFSSNNNKVVSITANGVVRAVGQGSATITATYKQDNTKKVSAKVKVEKTIAVGEIVLGKDNTCDEIDAERVRHGDPVNVDGMLVPVFVYEWTALKNGNLTIEIPITAYARKDDGTVDYTKKLTVSSSWKSSNKKIANPVSATSTNNKNTITVMKGSSGEAMITVSVKNTGEKEATAQNTRKFIIRVVDSTPRLGNSTITVNSLSTIGTKLKIVPVYGYDFVGDSLEILKKDTSSSTGWSLFKSLSIYYNSEEGSYYVKRVADKPFAFTYNNTLCIQGVFSDSGDKFQIPLKEVVVTQKELNPKVKVSGKINLFYDVTTAPELSGSVKVTPDISSQYIDPSSLLLVSAEKTKNPTDDSDAFFNNFAPSVSEDGKSILIRRKAGTEIKKDKNKKIITSGFVKFKFKGYTTEFVRPVTVTVTDTAPSLTLSKTSANASIYKDEAEFEFSVVDKKTKKKVLDLTDQTKLNIQNETLVLDMFDISRDNDTDIITVRVNEHMTPNVKKTAKVVFTLQSPEWSRALKFTYTVNFTETLPTAKLNTTKAVLNKTYPGESAELLVSQNMADAVLAGFGEVTYTGAAKNAEYGAALKNAMILTDPTKIVVKLPLDPNSVPNGTYKFKVTPKVTFNGEDTPNAKNSVSFSVTVKESKPVIKLKKSTFTLNCVYSGLEEVSTTYSISNLPTGVKAADVDVTTAEIDVVKKNSSGPDFDDIAEIRFENGNAIVNLKELDNSDRISYGGKTYSYVIKGLKAKCNEPDPAAEMNDVTISIKLNKADPAIKIKSSGTINPIDMTTKVTCKVNVSNMVSDVSSVKLWQVDSKTGGFCTLDPENPQDTSKYYSPDFTYEIVGGNKILIKAKDEEDVVIKSGKKYKIWVVCGLTNAPGFTTKTLVTFTPKQTFPKYTAKKTSSTIFAGQADRTVKFRIKMNKPGKNEKLVTADLVAPAFAKGTSKSIENVFTIAGYEVVDPATGEIEVTMVLDNPSSLVLDKKYDISLVPRFAHQDTSVDTTKFKVSITVNK